jgi:hypothetical protein
MKIMLWFYAALTLFGFWYVFVFDAENKKLEGFRRESAGAMQRVREIEQETEKLLQDARKRGLLPQHGDRR